MSEGIIIREPIKIERYILIEKEDINTYNIRKSNCVYIHVPIELRRQLLNFGIDLTKKDKLEIIGNVALEEDGVKLIYSFKLKNEDEQNQSLTRASKLFAFFRRLIK